MLVSRPDKCAARLLSGEAKRTPARTDFRLVGYYIGCPGCPKVHAIPFTHQVFDEHPDGTMSMTPGIECSRCGTVFSIDRDEVIRA